MIRKRINLLRNNLRNRVTMGIMSSKDFMSRRKIDEATSNASLSNMRYVITEKPKWKVFKKKEIVPIPAYPRAAKGCPCGSNGPCKQKVTPNGVTLHYPQKKRRFTYFATTKSTPTKSNRGFYNNRLHLSFQMNDKVKRMNMNVPKYLRKNPIKRLKIPEIVKKPLKKLNIRETVTKNTLKGIDTLKKVSKLRKKPERTLSKDFMFMPFLFS